MNLLPAETQNSSALSPPSGFPIDVAGLCRVNDIACNVMQSEPRKASDNHCLPGLCSSSLLHTRYSRQNVQKLQALQNTAHNERTSVPKIRVQDEYLFIQATKLAKVRRFPRCRSTRRFRARPRDVQRFRIRPRFSSKPATSVAEHPRRLPRTG